MSGGFVNANPDASPALGHANPVEFLRIATLAVATDCPTSSEDSRRLRDVPADVTSEEPCSELPPPDSSIHRSQLLLALSRLTSIRREVVLLHDLEGWTHAEIAGALRISELTSRQHLFLARRELRKQLDGKILEVEHA